MSQDNGPLLPHGGYRKPRSYTFWRCTSYPESKDSLSISSDRLDRSERSD